MGAVPLINKSDPYLSVGASLSRLLTEYQKYGRLIVAFDFDETVHDFHKKGYKFPKVIKLLKELKKIDCFLICFTANSDENYVKDYLLRHKIPFDTINEDSPYFSTGSRKIYYNVLLDDRAGLLGVYRELKTFLNIIKRTKKDV